MSPTTPAPVPKHPRQLLREAVVALLTGHTNAGTRVYKSRIRPLTSKSLPAIGVYTTEQRSDTGDTSPRRYSHTVTVVVQAIFELNDNLDDAMDALALQVESLLQADPTWSGTAEDSVLTKTTMSFVSDGRTDSGCLELEWEADFDTRPGLLVTASLDDFETAGVEMDLAPADGQPDAEDTIVVQTPAQEA